MKKTIRLFSNGEDQWADYCDGEIITVNDETIYLWDITDLYDMVKCAIYMKEKFEINETAAAAIIVEAMEAYDSDLTFVNI